MINPEDALKILLEGNKRFAQHKSIHPNRCNETRQSLLTGQKPIAVVISCSDSRVPTEIVFDAGLGDIFAIRTAGHVLSKEVMGSIEYAISLGCKLVMILGHENCGAIKAALKSYKTKKEVSPNLQSVLNHIYPAFEKISSDAGENCAVKANIEYQVQDLLKKDECIAEKFSKKEILVTGAIYNLSTGLVSLI